APSVVDFSNTPFIRGDFVLGDRSLIQTDPVGSVSINANTAAILGSIVVPGGTISITGSSKSDLLFDDTSNALPTVDLGPNSLLAAAGTARLVPNALGFRTGTVLTGGQITISGNVVAETGAVLNVSGASDVLDLPPAVSGIVDSAESLAGAVLTPTRVDSNGGSITFVGGQGLFVGVTLVGGAGGSGTGWGTLLLAPGG